MHQASAFFRLNNEKLAEVHKLHSQNNFQHSAHATEREACEVLMGVVCSLTNTKTGEQLQNTSKRNLTTFTSFRQSKLG